MRDLWSSERGWGWAVLWGDSGGLFLGREEYKVPSWEGEQAKGWWAHSSGVRGWRDHPGSRARVYQAIWRSMSFIRGSALSVPWWRLGGQGWAEDLHFFPSKGVKNRAGHILRFVSINEEHQVLGENRALERAQNPWLCLSFYTCDFGVITLRDASEMI